MIKELKKRFYNKFKYENETVNKILKSEVVQSEDSNENNFLHFINYLEEKSEKELFELSDLDKNRLLTDKIEYTIFPENRFKLTHKEITEIRNSRVVNITEVNKTPITNAFKQVLFTSNVLLTMPDNFSNIPEKLLNLIDQNEIQEYWFDHPIPLDIEDERNEIIFGLKNMDQAVREEGTGDKLTIILSVSCTHASLRNIAKEYIRDILAKFKFENIEVYIFTEDDTHELIEKYFDIDKKKKKEIQDVFGVDGKYGRHYSFLKALLPFWNKFVDKDKIGTFKIDLDQAFDQIRLKKETGKSAFDNFKSNLWGAKAVDINGTKLELGMIAGALVNDTDIKYSIYTPDATKPDNNINKELAVFNSERVRYLSTVVEMGTRYNDTIKCIKRYHVTGGTNGILLSSLYKYRPFTPSFIGRAEDQAYIMSVLNSEQEKYCLRYYHQDGLIMRHDKHSIISDTIEKSKISRLVGDFERIFIFSFYANMLYNFDYIKKELGPFTSCFISKTPYTLVYFRAIIGFETLSKNSTSEKEEYIKNLVKRLKDVMEKLDDNYYTTRFNTEKEIWKDYYNYLNDAKYQTNINNVKSYKVV
ncbi:MAG: hypothetical protein OCD02_17065 [Spirochaetaceae bacterium]